VTGVNTSNNDGSNIKLKNKGKTFKKGESYELDEEIRGLPTDLDRAAGPVQPREDT
jgi:hypothetical protein